MVRAIGAALPPLTLPSKVLFATEAKEIVPLEVIGPPVNPVPVDTELTEPADDDQDVTPEPFVTTTALLVVPNPVTVVPAPP